MFHRESRKVRISLLLSAAAFLALATAPGARAENTDPDDDGSQWAWGENVGWISAEPSGNGGPGLQIDDFHVSGWLWGENIGWISTTCENTVSCHVVEYRVRHDGAGGLSGMAWGENVGWINFAPIMAGVFVDPVSGELNGHAWGENIGWVAFKSSGANPHVVKTAWRCDPPPPPPIDPPVLRLTKGAPPVTELQWDPLPGATGYDVVFGELIALRNDPSHLFAATLGCMGENVLDIGAVFDLVPPPGDGFWFLVRGVNCGGSGTYNSLWPSQPDDRDEPIGDSTRDCAVP